MKKVLLLVMCISVFTCKNEGKATVSEAEDAEKSQEISFQLHSKKDGLITLKGNFIYYGDAAVMQTSNEIYGVVINDKMLELNNKAKKFKTKDTDMVLATVKARKFPKPEGEEGWPLRLEIKEILKIEPELDTNKTITLDK